LIPSDIMFEVLDASNIMLYAAKHYENASCMDIEEFNDDLNRVKYIKRLFRKYRDGGELKERLILNHLIILYNVISPPACTRILCFELYEYLKYLKPFLVLLNFWPDVIKGIGKHGNIFGSDIVMDATIVNILRKI